MNAEQMILLSQKLVMLSFTNNQADRERLTKEIAALNAELTESAGSNEKTVCCGPLKFSDKEISKMPKTFRKEFRVHRSRPETLRRSLPLQLRNTVPPQRLQRNGFGANTRRSKTKIY